jgi:hypothetical protein
MAGLLSRPPMNTISPMVRREAQHRWDEINGVMNKSGLRRIVRHQHEESTAVQELQARFEDQSH